MLIAIEGIDQSGKATLAAALKSRLETTERKAQILSFPDYSTPIGRLIRRMLDDDPWHDPATMQLLNAANRNEHRETLAAAVMGERIVICDRYTGSGTAYGKAQGLPEAWLEQIDDRVPAADRTLLLNADPSRSRERKTDGRDRYERDDDLLERVRRQYRHLAETRGWAVIDGGRSPESVADAAWAELEPLFEARRL